MQVDLDAVLYLLVDLCLPFGFGLELLLKVLQPVGRDGEQQGLELVDVEYLLLEEPFLGLADELEEEVDQEHPLLVNGGLRDAPVLKRGQVVALALLPVDPHDRYD